jgi:guanylate kinase
VISAPSGAGKSTLVKRLLPSIPGLCFSVSHTTRRPRPGEQEGRDYFFVTPAKFRAMVTESQFAEWADVFGNFYGTTWEQIREAQDAGLDVLLDIDVQGHQQIKQHVPDALSIFVLPPSFQELERRLLRRHLDSPEVIQRRLLAARNEMSHWPEYDYVIVNDRLPLATKAIQAVVLAARCRRINQERRVNQIFESFGG